MATIYYEKDADPAALQGQRIAVLGYGSQGHAHALNLRDSGHDVRVGLREGSKSGPGAEEQGLAVRSTAEAAAEADVVMMLQPDTAQADVYAREVEPGLQPGNLLLFAHGFNIHFNQIRPAESLDVAMVAPKGPGHLVRRTYVEKIGTPALLAVHRDATGTARQRTLAYAAGIGSARAGEIRSGEFAKEWVLEARAGYPKFEALRAQGREQLIEEVGKGLRSMMPWLRGGLGGGAGPEDDGALAAPPAHPSIEPEDGPDV